MNPPYKFNPEQEAAREKTLAFGGGLINGDLTLKHTRAMFGVAFEE